MMRISSKKAYLFLLGVFIIDCVFAESHLIDYAFVDTILTIVRYASLILIILISYRKGIIAFNKNLWFIYLFTVCGMINSFFCEGGTGALFIIVIMLSFRKFDLHSENLFPYIFKLIGFSSVFIFLLSVMGMIDDTVGTRTIGMEMGNFFAREYTRHSFGFLAANQIPLNLTIMYILRISYKREKISLIENILWFVINYIIFIACGSRMAFIMTTFLISSHILMRLVDKFYKKEKMHRNNHPKLWLCFVLCFFFSIYASFEYNYGSIIWKYLNNVFMDRFRMAYFAIRQYGITLFGQGLKVSQSIEGITNGTIDNGYISLLLQRGILICLIVMFIWCYLTFTAEKNGNKYLLLGLVALSLMNIIDAHFLTYKMIPYYCLMIEEGSSLFTIKRRGGIQNASFNHSTSL